MNTMIAMIPILPPAIPITVQPAPHTHTTHTQCPSLSRPLSRSPLTAIASRKQNEKEPAHHAGEGGGGRKELLCLLKRTPQSTPQNGTARAHACARSPLSRSLSSLCLSLIHSPSLFFACLLTSLLLSLSPALVHADTHLPQTHACGSRRNGACRNMLNPAPPHSLSPAPGTPHLPPMASCIRCLQRVDERKDRGGVE